jgi:hypothetical protein
MEYESKWRDQLGNILIKFPNLLHLSIRLSLNSDNEALNFFYWHDMDHPLRSITLKLNPLKVIYILNFLQGFKDTLVKGQLPNIRSLLLSSNSSVDDWKSFLQAHPLPVMDSYLFETGTRLKERSSSASGLEKSGVWLVGGRDDDSFSCEFTRENLRKIRLGLPV